MQKLFVSSFLIGSFLIAAPVFAATTSVVGAPMMGGTVVPTGISASSDSGTLGAPAVAQENDDGSAAQSAPAFRSPSPWGGERFGRNGMMGRSMMGYRTEPSDGGVMRFFAALAAGITLILGWLTMLMIIVSLVRWNRQQSK